jgi:hypothetical protein
MLSVPSFAAGPLDSVAFLRGCWVGLNENREQVTENWLRNTNGAMLGVSEITNTQNDLLAFEFMEIVWSRELTQLLFTPTLNGRRLNTFSLDLNLSRKLHHGGNILPMAVFVSPSNPTMKSITYALKARDVLMIRLQGHQPNGQTFDISYDLRRRDCRAAF